jgi:peptide/nickel transport system substrate-binding protein
MQQKRLSRREFLRLSIVAGVGAALAACAPATAVPTQVPTKAPEATKAPASTTAPTAAPAATQPPAATKPPAATAAPAAKYSESPKLAELVKAGKLPPIEQRLPADVKVLKPFGEVGKYGGTQRGPAYGPKIGQLDTHALRRQPLVAWETDLKTLTPNILKDYKASEDYKTWTLTLRKGMKYNDGTPFTADDFVFWYEDVLLNKELTPTVPTVFIINKEPLKLSKVDDLTIKVEFAGANPNFDLFMARSYETSTMFAPKAYLKQWHIKYNDKANDLAKSEKFDTWAQAFAYHNDRTQAIADPKLPTLDTWTLTKIDDLGNKYFDRNPYYWVVDTAGNQLPYIDSQVAVQVKDKDVRNLKLIAKELDNCGENPLPLADYTLYKDNETKGDYKVFLFDNTRGGDVGFALNMTHKDPVLRKIYSEVKFRQALSMAINRKQINDVRAFGKGLIRQATIPPSVSFYESWMGDYFIEYSVDKANALLDEIGLKWDAAKKVRTRPDGKPLEIVMETWEEFAPFAEMVAEMWSVVGVKTTMKQEERSLWDQRQQANELDAMADPYDSVAEPVLRSNSMSRLRPGADTQMMLWRLWFQNAGKQGEEPTAEMKDLYALCDKFAVAKPASPEYMALGKEIATKYTQSLVRFGAYLGPRVIIFSNKLGNVPLKGTFANDYGFWDPYQGQQWYFKA